MHFTLLGALQGDAIRKRLSSFQRQSYIPVILAVQDSKVLQTTQALTTTEYQVRCLLKRRVETGEDLWPVPQPPGSSSPAYGYPPTANRWHLFLTGFYGSA